MCQYNVMSVTITSMTICPLGRETFFGSINYLPHFSKNPLPNPRRTTYASWRIHKVHLKAYTPTPEGLVVKGSGVFVSLAERAGPCTIVRSNLWN